MNFVETYSAGWQDKIQSVPWTHPQINIFMYLTWLKSNTICSFLVRKSLTST